MAEIHELPLTASTNSDAKRLAEDGAPHGTVVWAHRQTAGRGRHGRAWQGTDGNLFWSILLRPEPSWPSLGELVYANALAVLSACRQVTGDTTPFALKWPNDLLLHGRKVAGSLLEARMTPSRHADWVIVGTGINIVHHPEDSEVLFPATSLHAAGYTQVQREDFVVLLRDQLLDHIQRWLDLGFSTIRQDYKRELFHLNQMVHVGTGPDRSTYRHGVLKDVSEDGALLLLDEAGVLHRLHSGDVLLPA